MKTHRTILKIVSLFIVFGGIVRLFANETVFSVFGMNDLWTNHAYFIYIYRALGAFVILTGLIIYTISRDINKSLNILNTIKWGIFFIGLTMLISGLLVNLPIIFYFPDFLFCFLISILFQIIINKRNRPLNH